MNSTNTNSGSWQATARRGWCNGGFRGALSSDLQAAFKLFNCITGQLNGTTAGGSNITTQDYFALFAEKEILGTRTYSTANESTALFNITWYETASNRIKQVSASSYDWWERSPRFGNSLYFCAINSNGGVDTKIASTACGISPFGCL